MPYRRQSPRSPVKNPKKTLSSTNRPKTHNHAGFWPVSHMPPLFALKTGTFRVQALTLYIAGSKVPVFRAKTALFTKNMQPTGLDHTFFDISAKST